MIELSADTQLGSLIENPFGDKYLFSVNRNKFQDLDYYTQFNQEFTNTFQQKDTLYIIVGTDSGMLVKQLLQTPPEQGSTFLFIEFPEIIELTENLYNLKDQPRIIVTTEDQWEEQAKAIGVDIYFIINKVRPVKSFAAQYHYISEYLFLWKTIEERIKHLSWQYQSQLGSKTFVQKQLENIAENHTPAIQLKGHFKGKSALILAGGPSLDNYIDWIKANQKHYVVIAVSRIARRLLETGIKPDIFISVDPYPINFDVSKEIYHFEKDSLLVHQYHVSPMLLGNWLGANLYLGKALPWEAELNLENFDGIGPTVTNTAILFAIQMGIKEQILFGVDLCYNPNGYTHAKGSKENDSGPVLNEIGQRIITNNGNYAETNSAYYDAILSIEKLAELACNTGAHIINPSKHSARMNNVEYKTIDKIKVNQENICIKTILQKLFKQQNSDYKIKHYKLVLKELEKAQYKIRKIITLAKKGLEYNNKLFENNEPEKNFKYKLKMDKIEKELNQGNYSDFSELAKKFGVNEFLYFLNTDNSREMTNEEIRDSGQTYYKALKTGASELEHHIFTAINRTEIRLLENNYLKINNNLLKRHLCSFNQSLLLERQIVRQQNLISNNINKWTDIERKSNHKILEQLVKNKQSTIKELDHLYTLFKSHDELLGKNEQDRFQTLSFFILMLQNKENYQTRRILVCAKENPDLLNLPEYIRIFDHKPNYYIQKQCAINNIIKNEKENLELLKIKNIIANSSDNFRPVKVLKNCFKNKQTIILTDRDSLSKYRQWIVENQSHFIVIAYSHLAEKLINTKITPDFFVIDESDEDEFDKHKAIIHFEKSTVLINHNHLSPKILANWLGTSYFIGDIFPWDCQINIDNIHLNNANIFETTLNIAHLLGLNDLVLFINHELYERQKHHINSVTNELNIKLLTPLKIEQNNIIKHINLAEIKVPDREVKALNYIEKISNTDSKRKISHYKKIREESIKTITKLKLICCHLNHTSHEDTIKDDKLFNLARIFSEKELDIFKDKPVKKLKSGFNQLLRHIHSAELTSEIRLIENEQLILNKSLIEKHLDNDNNVFLDNKINMKQIINMRKFVLDTFHANNNILGITEEDKIKSVTFFIVFSYYGLNQQQRRLLLLEKQNSNLLNISENIEFKQGVNKKVIIQSQKERIDQVFNTNMNSLKYNGLEIKLYSYFTQKDTTSLKNIIHNIEESTSDIDNSYLHLARGYLYELEEDIEMAILEYGQAESHSTRESALKRITFISLEQGELEFAHHSLQILSEISPEYLTQLAELYVITKNYNDALNTYTEYLNYNNNDIPVLLKVAKIYDQQKMDEASTFIYNHIRKLDPNALR